MKIPECILYVCCSSKCKKKGVKEIYKNLKSHVKHERLKQQVKVIKTSCTDNCKKGPIIAAMPYNQWHTHTTVEDGIKILHRYVNKE